MKLRITVLPGDGVGPEVTQEAVRILRTVADINGYNFEFNECLIGGAAIVAEGHPFPRKTMDACLDSDAVLLGAVGGPGFDSLSPQQRPEAGLLQLRKALGGFANLRPAVAYESIAASSPLRPEILKGANVLFVRELLGGLYFGEPRGVDDAYENGYNTMRYSAEEVRRVAKVAFELARGRRQKLTSVDKANVLETSRLWRKVVNDVARDYPDVTLEHCLVDSFAMQLILDPRRFDVVVTENLFGDILSDEASVISGSLGMLASATIGGAIDLYEPVHGSAPDIAGKGIANPLGAIASAAMLLRHTAKLEHDAADIESAIVAILDSGLVTPDLQTAGGRGTAHTQEVGSAVERMVADLLNRRMAYHAV